MSSVDIRMDGFDELLNRLKSLADSEPIAKIALEKAGEHLRGAIENTTPVRTGALKASIVKDEVKDNKILIGPSQQGPAFRAHFVEYGTTKMSAQPFMRPTFEQQKTRLQQIMAEEIREGLGL